MTATDPVSPPPMPHLSRLAAAKWPRHGLGITVRTALLAWLVTIGTVLVFAAAIVPEQKRALLDQLLSKARGVAVSLREIAAGAAISEDYSSVVEYCVEMLKGDSAIDYIVLTRNDGFSLVHDRVGWRSQSLAADWLPPERVARGAIQTVPPFARRAYHFSQPFDYSGIKWGWIHVGLSLAGYDRSVATVYWRTGWLAAGCMLLGLVATFLYAKYLVRPILALQSVVHKVAGGDLSARAITDRTDELGQLATSINAMTEALLRRDRTLKEANETLEQRVHDRTRALQRQVAATESANRALAEAQQHLMQLSRDAGRAEIATGVLHSVGNVLNSVNVSATLVQEQLNRSQLAGLQRAVGLLRQHADDLPDYLVHDPKGRHLPDFIIAVARALAAEHATWRSELAGLAKNITHIKEIVSMQQSYARVAGVTERLAPREMVQDAIRINQAAFTRDGVALVTDFQPTPEIVVDKHKVLQILVNLLANAKWAVETRPPGERTIALSLRTAGERVHIAVTDNGVGITPENRTKVFQHGFTTRQDGHGFGLHMGALAARELGGSLRVESDGEGRGATFTLELPAGSTAETR